MTAAVRLHTEPRGLRSVVLGLIGLGLVASVAAGLLLGFRAAGYTLAAVLAVATVARLLLPVSAVGPLAVRSRTVDVAVSGSFAVALVFLARTAPG